jgi:hypothetical protein
MRNSLRRGACDDGIPLSKASMKKNAFGCFILAMVFMAKEGHVTDMMTIRVPLTDLVGRSSLILVVTAGEPLVLDEPLVYKPPRGANADPRGPGRSGKRTWRFIVQKEIKNTTAAKLPRLLEVMDDTNGPSPRDVYVIPKDSTLVYQELDPKTLGGHPFIVFLSWAEGPVLKVRQAFETVDKEPEILSLIKDPPMEIVAGPFRKVDPDPTTPRRVARFLEGVDREISRLAPHHPQLASWALTRIDRLSGSGKFITADEFEYAHGMVESRSGDYKERYGPHGCTVNVKVYKADEAKYVAGKSIKMGLYLRPLGDRFVSSSVITENPEVPSLEKALNEIIREQLLKAAE